MQYLNTICTDPKNSLMTVEAAEIRGPLELIAQED